MKKKVIFSILFCFTLFSASSIFGQNDIFIKQIEFKLDFISDTDYENEYFMTIKLNKGIKYKFKVSNHIEDYAGEAVIELLDADKLVVTNIIQGKYYEQFGFHCNKTAFYDILIKFRDNKVGYSTLDLFMIQ